MKIKRITATPVNIRFEAPYIWSFGSLLGLASTIVEVETEDGLVGIGEAPSAYAARLIDDDMAPRLIGWDAFDIAGAERRCVPFWSGVQSTNDQLSIYAFGAIEMALWDLRGKAWNQPLYQLLGGAVRKEIPFTDYFVFREDGPVLPDGSQVKGEKTPEAVADYCVMLNEKYGTTYFEGKFSTPDPKVSLRVLELIRKQLGDSVMLRIDSNQAYSVASAIKIAKPLEELGVRYWEEPVVSPEEMALLRQHCSIPFSAHNTDLQKAMTLRVPDAIVTSPSSLGGIGRTVRFVGACEHAKIDFWCYSGDSSVGSAAYLHLCAALGWIREPNQSLFRMQPVNVTEEGSFAPKNNMVKVPEGPGLGITLSKEMLKRCHQDLLENGPLNRYNNPANPGFNQYVPFN
jgi:glucarate dehydratase